MMKRFFFILILSVLAMPILLGNNPKREMRATWLTSVANIDWPLPTTKGKEAQQKELIALLDACVKFNMNTVLLHIRPACDALYKSSYERKIIPACQSIWGLPFDSLHMLRINHVFLKRCII